METKQRKPNLRLRAEREDNQKRDYEKICKIIEELGISMEELKAIIGIEFNEMKIGIRKRQAIFFALTDILDVNLIHFWHPEKYPLFKRGIKPDIHFKNRYLIAEGISAEQCVSVMDSDLLVKVYNESWASFVKHSQLSSSNFMEAYSENALDFEKEKKKGLYRFHRSREQAYWDIHEWLGKYRWTK